MTQSQEGRHHGYRESIFSGISAGFFFILFGIILATTPHLIDGIIDLIKDFRIIQVPNTALFLPGPERPYAHAVVYSAAGTFSFIWGLFEIAMLVVRFVSGSPVSKKAENAGNIAFWLGTSYLIGVFLNDATRHREWFAFWAATIALIGFTLIIRAIILSVAEQMAHARA